MPSPSGLSIDTLALAFPREALSGQFALGRSLPVVPEGWTVAEVPPFRVAHDRQLPLRPFRDEAGRTLGAILGHPIDLAELAADGPLTAPLRSGAPDASRLLADWLGGLGGRFVALETGETPRLHPDGYGSLPVFWDASTATAASSPFLLRDDVASLRVRELFRVLDPFGTGRVLGFGVTPYEGVEHLVANHILDLASWHPERQWLSSRPQETSVEAAAVTVADVVERTIEAAIRGGTACMGLTAGGDTRVLLAAAGPERARKLELVTFAFPDGLGATDLLWAQRIAARFALRHRVVPYREATARDVSLFAYRTGGMNGDLRGRYAAPTYEQLAPWTPYLGGANGGMLRGQEWPRRLSPDDVLDPPTLLRALALPPHPELVERVEQWQSSLPSLDALDLVTMAMLEGHDCAWTGSLTLAFQEGRPVNVYPLTHRRVIEACLATPWQERRADALRRAIIADRWPELLAFPFNRPPLAVRLRRHGVQGWRIGRAALRRSRRLVSRRTAHS